MKKTLATAFISFGIIALLAVGGYLFIQHLGSNDEEPTGATEYGDSKEEPEVLETVSASLPEDMNEARLQFYLHEMTHSKVYAEDKWGAVRPMSEENIEELLAIVEASKFEKKAYYRNTLEAWQKGDFSNAVDVHNTIWHWHNGSVGKATRLMTDEEEQAYMEENF
ncbi:hypothetical protein B0H99_10726 [Planomicrobium soli]|uniref:Uncharacterized protein n=1 Tax=Planomicrobium soli TaxID=1176648 RepID=A0A2P8GQI1_9BACL|nr:DUF6241 domain-containing protein [Planomicrobium soli]PSL36205.1 hypothetical protein B0H99_10726 [Planomicrobium soli]